MNRRTYLPIRISGAGNELSLITLSEKNTGTLLYRKPSEGLVLLREQILGPETF